jgi:hypothetical protein
MQSALHITTKVLPGSRIEIQLPDLTEGQEVDVFIVLPIEIAQTNSRDRVALLAQMAEDPEIQQELVAIDSEFSITQMDGLGTK